MQIREAILKAADQIEAHPYDFMFSSVCIPEDNCGSPGCALGWIAFFLGAELPAFPGHQEWDVVRATVALGIPSHGHVDCEFYRRLDSFLSGWRENADLCALALRLYADKYHPAIKTPNWEALAKPDLQTFACG